MTEAIINYLNLKLETVGRLGVIHCLAELRSDGTTTVPYVYSGTGQVVPINIDGGNLSYWRMPNAISFDPIVGNYGVKQLTGTYDLRLVIVARRKDSTVDDAFMPTRLAEDVTGSFPDLKLLLKAQSVSIRVNSIDTNIPKVWGEEFTGTQVSDLNYTRAIMALSVSVTVTGSRECWQNECDIDPDILHIFNFCDPNTVDRLTETQLICLGEALCTPVGVSVNTVPFATEPAGGSVNVPVQQNGVNVGSLVAGVWVIPPAAPCLDGNIELNGVQVATVASGGTEDIVVRNTGVTPVGALDGADWQVADSPITRNGISIDSVAAEATFPLLTTLDGAPNNGVYNSGTKTLAFTSAACNPAALQINGSTVESIASGATFNLIALLDGVAGGTYDAPTDTLAFTSNSGWIRPAAWITMPTLTAADERFYGIVAVFENRYNVIAVTLNSTSSNINWGDGTSVVSNGGQRVKVYDYASLVGTVNVWPTGENYKQVLVDITRVGVAITSMDWITLGAVNYYGGNNFIDVNFSLPSLTTCNLSLDPPSGTKGMTMLQRLRIWSSGTIAGQFFRGLKSLRVVQFPATFQGSFSNAFLNGGEVDDCGNMNFGTSTAITNFWSGTGLKKHGSYTANSVVGNGTNYVQYCGQLAQFGTINATLQTTFDSFFYECYTLMAVGLITAPAATNLSSMFFRCTILGSVQFSNCATVTTTTSMFGNCVGLFDCVMPNLTRGVNFTGTAMANYGMNRFANSLGIASGAQTITATGTPFSALITAADATALAIRAVITGKGFTYTN